MTRHPLREPMLWLVMLLPAAVVVAGIATLVIAIRSGGNDAVPDAVRRTAQVQTAELGPDDVARRRGLVAVLQVRGDGVRVLPVQGDFDRTRPLQLTLAHPVQAAQDRHLVLQPDADGWHAAGAPDATHDWPLLLQADDGAWRVHGRLPAGQQAAHLVSSLHGGGAG